VIRAPAEALPFPPDSFDAVVCTLVLCTVHDPAAALDEIARVLVPGGKLLFVEHVRGDRRLARWQDRFHPLWLRLAHGCHCNRPTADLLAASPLSVERCERGRLPKAPPIVQPLISGVAVARQ
jgi:SAM-dependent methyltransferase